MNHQQTDQEFPGFGLLFAEELSHRANTKNARGTKLVRDRLKANRERREDARVMKQAEYYQPFMEA